MDLDVKKLLINAALAGLYVGLTAAAAVQVWTWPILLGVGAMALRAFIGFLASAIGHEVPVDK